MMTMLHVPQSGDLLVRAGVYADGVLGDGWALVLAGTPEHADWLSLEARMAAVGGTPSTAPAAMFHLLRQLYVARGLTPPV
jgi:hypothetical protein